MRRFIILVPLALVAGYAVLAGTQRHHRRQVVVSVAQPPEAPTSGHGSNEAMHAQAVALATRAEELATIAEGHAARVESASAIATAQASVTVSLEGLIATIERELERSAESGEPIELRSLEVSAELLAQIAAQFEGALEIQASDTNGVVVGSGDGARVTLTVR
jgi:hypothetical protein